LEGFVRGEVQETKAVPLPAHLWYNEREESFVDRSDDWLGQGRGELAAARDLLVGGHWAWCCFTCQQAAEKALKAALEHFRAGRPGHNLNELRQAVEAHTAVPVAIQDACARLNRFYIPTRYPDAFPSGMPVDQFFERDAREALADAEEMIQFVGAALGSP
jgi:HEPN domain-containing protein